MSIQLLKKNTNVDPDMDSYKKNLFRHRLRNLGIGAGVLSAVALCLFGVGVGMQNRTYETYEVVESHERSDTMNTRYTEFLSYVLKYSKDGISCVDSDNRLVWSQTYNMQNPVVDVCKGSAVVAEGNGTDAMVFDKTGLQGTIGTRLPIRQIEVSSQGVVAALLEDGDVMRLNLYNKKGEELANSKFELKETGYPLRMSLSTDATKLAVTFVQVQDGGINACLAFYNFDSVGENYADHMVAAKTIAGTVMPGVHYIDDTHCFAVGTEQLLLYEGKQIPELKAEIPLDREVYSVAASDRGIGLIVEGTEKKYALQVYNTQGNLEFETEFDQEYRELKFSGGNILVYDEFDCMILNDRGKVFFSGTFQESISNLYTLSGRSRYAVMHASRTDEIHLK